MKNDESEAFDFEHVVLTLPAAGFAHARHPAKIQTRILAFPNAKSRPKNKPEK